MVDVREVDFISFAESDTIKHGIKIFNNVTNKTCCIDLNTLVPCYSNFKVIKQYQNINLRNDK